MLFVSVVLGLILLVTLISMAAHSWIAIQQGDMATMDSFVSQILQWAFYALSPVIGFLFGRSSGKREVDQFNTQL